MLLPPNRQTEFDTLLGFLENHAFDKLLYWCVASSKKDMPIIEIQWHKQEPLPWRLKERGKLFWQSVSRDNLTAALAGLAIDWDQLIKAWQDTARQQVIYARVVLNEAEETFGGSFVDEAIREHEELMQALLQALHTIDNNNTPPQPTPAATTATKATKGSHLSLVKPNDPLTPSPSSWDA